MIGYEKYMDELKGAMAGIPVSKMTPMTTRFDANFMALLERILKQNEMILRQNDAIIEMLKPTKLPMADYADYTDPSMDEYMQKINAGDRKSDTNDR
jgi:hypothetical protein